MAYKNASSAVARFERTFTDLEERAVRQQRTAVALVLLCLLSLLVWASI
jgi:hypothetical protein